MNTFRKSNIINSIVVGEISAISLILVSKNLKTALPFLDVVRFQWQAFVVAIPVLTTLVIYGTFLLGRVRPVFFQFGKFAIIGLSNAIIDFGVLNLLIFVTDIERGYYYSLFKALSATAAVANSYLWNRVWAFEGSEPENTKKQFLQFLTVSIVGTVINVVVAHVVVNIIGTVGEIPPRLWANLGALIAIVSGGLWNFLGYKFIVFNSDSKLEER